MTHTSLISLSTRRAACIAAAAAVAALSACASAPIPIHLAGQPEALSALVGNWSGVYRGFESKRVGSISFSLRAGDTAAFGEVLMIPREFDHHDVWTEREQHRTVARQHPQVLTITFVGIASQRVTGMLDPYTDPDCECQVLTTFMGRLTSPTTLEGTFVTRVPGTPRIQTGTWSARRRQ